jgi:phage-related protein
MTWQIDYYSDSVEGDVLNLPDGLLARYLRLTDLMQEFGANLGMPHTKVIQNGLFELRLKAKEGIARTFYAQKLVKKLWCYTSSSKRHKKFQPKNLKLPLNA